ncbi:hypothetical protein C8Q77DRAFT_764505 [Trametes polyzona]|nr:hypothetical protein C8Q77DRAFT_764505 [Trametes polyzona]
MLRCTTRRSSLREGTGSDRVSATSSFDNTGAYRSPPSPHSDALANVRPSKRRRKQGKLHMIPRTSSVHTVHRAASRLGSSSFRRCRSTVDEPVENAGR